MIKGDREVTGETRPPRPSAGTRTMWGAAKALFRPPAEADAAADQQAFRDGEGRTVSCFLRGPGAPYPRRLRQGSLKLTRDGISWRPFWSLRRRSIMINERIRSVDVRQAGRSEWNLKKGGNAYGIPVPELQVIVCQTDRGVLELSVPDTDVGLVVTALKH